MKKTTLTIGVPAYNEELNIEEFLVSLLDQKLKKTILKEILVYSDASSDNTNKIVAKLAKKYPVIKLIKGTSRKGKYFRVNELFTRSKTDVLVILDADIAMEGNHFLEKLVTALIADKKALMVAAHVDLVRPKGFIAKVLYTTFVIGDYMRFSVPGYDIAPNFHGAATAYRNTFIKTLSIPTNTTDPHLYIYLAAKKRNGFRYCRNAVILQNAPITVHDVKQLMHRSIGKEDAVLEKMFGHEMIKEVHRIPRRAKVQGVLTSFLQEPFFTPLALLVSFYLGRMVHIKNIDKSPIWEINKSTKKPIHYVKK